MNRIQLSNYQFKTKFIKRCWNLILAYLENNPASSSKDVFDGLNVTKGYATVKRCLTQLIEKRYVSKVGIGKGTKYDLSHSYAIIKPIDIDAYFNQDIDERIIQSSYNFNLIHDILPSVELFSQDEINKLLLLQKQFEVSIKSIEKIRKNATDFDSHLLSSFLDEFNALCRHILGSFRDLKSYLST